MSHLILENKMMLLRDEPGWHNLGTVFTDGPTMSEALVRIDGDFDITKEQNYVWAPGGLIKAPGQYSLIRHLTADDTTVLGSCGERYEVIQHRDFVRYMEPVNQQWPLETLGVLKDGELIFATFAMGGRAVLGIDSEYHKSYLLISNTTDGGTAVASRMVSTRVVCWNTHQMAMHGATAAVDISHMAGANAELKFHGELIAAAIKAEKESGDAMDSLALKVLNGEMTKELIARIYPEPKKPARLESAVAEHIAIADATFAEMIRASKERYELAVQRQEQKREVVKDLFGFFNDNFSQVGSTAYALFQSVVETEDWMRGRNVNESALFGERARNKEFAYATIVGEVGRK